jgi:hypothetical protein
LHGQQSGGDPWPVPPVQTILVLLVGLLVGEIVHWHR